MVAFDATVLLVLLDPDAEVGDPGSDGVVSRARERVDALIAALDQDEERVVVPTPALAELLAVAADAGPAYLATLTHSPRFHIADFDQRAAVELAAWAGAAHKTGDKRAGLNSAYQKIKVDRQIVAIAKVNGVRRIYTDDADVMHIARQQGIEVQSIADLPLPPAAQMALQLDEPT